jgi:hypothetical protein
LTENRLDFNLGNCSLYLVTDNDDVSPDVVRAIKGLCIDAGWQFHVVRLSKAPRKTGRPGVSSRPGFQEAFAPLLPRILAKEISVRRAATVLGISARSLRRLMGSSTHKQSFLCLVSPTFAAEALSR